MFGLGHLPELLVGLVIATFIFGPEKVSKIVGTVVGAIREYNRAKSSVQNSIKETLLQPITSSLDPTNRPAPRQLPTSPQTQTKPPSAVQDNTSGTWPGSGS